MARFNKRRHLTISLSKLSRGKGKSFTSGLAYILRLRLHDSRLGKTHNHTRKGGMLACGKVGWPGDLDSLRHAASQAERRANAVEGRELIVAFPRELPLETCLLLLEQLARWLFERHHVASVYAVHAPDKDGSEKNVHGHLIFTSRRVGDDGVSLAEKTREWDTATGRQLTEDLRAYWCGSLNQALEAQGELPDVEHRSFARLGIERTPSKHRGVAKTAQMRRRAKLEAETQIEKAAHVIRPLPTPFEALPRGTLQAQPTVQIPGLAPDVSSLAAHLNAVAEEFVEKVAPPAAPAEPKQSFRPAPVPKVQPEPAPVGPLR